MRIVVNDIAASKTGALAILVDFYEYVKNNAKEHEWIFLTGGDYIKECSNIKIIERKDVKSSQKNRLVFDLVNGSKFIESLEPDIIFSLQNTLTRGSVRCKGKKIPQVLYVHQPLGYQEVKNFSLFKKEEKECATYQHLIGRLIDMSVKQADRVIVQTDWMREAVSRKTHKQLENIIKILPDIPDLSAYVKDAFESNAFFFPSGEMIYKNHELVIKAAGILNKRGYKDFKVYFTLDGLSGMTDRTYDDPYNNICWIGRIGREEVLEWYNKSTLIFPSYIETFGVPLAEARQFGSIILASDCPFSHEVLEGYNSSYYFNPFDEEKLADLMEMVLKGEIIRKQADYVRENKASSYGEIVKVLESLV